MTPSRHLRQQAETEQALQRTIADEYHRRCTGILHLLLAPPPASHVRDRVKIVHAITKATADLTTIEHPPRRHRLASATRGNPMVISFTGPTALQDRERATNRARRIAPAWIIADPWQAPDTEPTHPTPTWLKLRLRYQFDADDAPAPAFADIKALTAAANHLEGTSWQMLWQISQHPLVDRNATLAHHVVTEPDNGAGAPVPLTERIHLRGPWHHDQAHLHALIYNRQTHRWQQPTERLHHRERLPPDTGTNATSHQ